MPISTLRWILCVSGGGSTTTADLRWNGKRFIVTAKIRTLSVEGYTQKMKKRSSLGDPDVTPNNRPWANGRATICATNWRSKVAESIKKGARAVVEARRRTQGCLLPAPVLGRREAWPAAYDDEAVWSRRSVIRAENDSANCVSANDSRYGLGGGIFSRERGRAHAKPLAERAVRYRYDHAQRVQYCASEHAHSAGCEELGLRARACGFGMKESSPPNRFI